MDRPHSASAAGMAGPKWQSCSTGQDPNMDRPHSASAAGMGSMAAGSQPCLLSTTCNPAALCWTRNHLVPSSNSPFHLPCPQNPQTLNPDT